LLKTLLKTVAAVDEVVPFVSVIIPTRNRPGPLGSCLSHLASQDYPRDRFEVIVVDDGSHTPLDDTVDPFRERMNLTLLRQRNAGCGLARNKGASIARGELLAFTDDDAQPRPDWVAKLAQVFQTQRESIIGGRTVNALPENIYSSTSQLLIDVLYVHFNSGPTGPRFFAANNIAVPASGFRELGGFDRRFHLSAAEDRDLCERWLLKGWPMAYSPQAVVLHAHDLTFRKFWRQHFNYGRGAYRYYQVRRCRDHGHTQMELGLYPRIVCAPFRTTSFIKACGLVGLLIVTQVAHTLGYFRERVGLNPSAPAAEC